MSATADAAGRAAHRGAAAEGAEAARRGLRRRHRRAASRRAATSTRTAPSRRSRRRGGSRLRSRNVRERRAGRRSDRQADAGEGRTRRGGQAVRGARKKLAGLGRADLATRDVSTPTSGADRHLRRLRRQGRLCLPAHARQGSAARARPAGGARRSAREAADPEGDELRRAPAATTTTSSSSARRTGCSRCTAPTSCRDRARPRCRSHHGRPPLPRSRDDIEIATADAYEETLRSGRQGDRRASPSAARRSSPACAAPRRGATVDHARRAARRSDRAGRMAGRLRRARSTRRSSTVPQECLILTMQQNQKYFALADGDGRLVPRFLVVSNIETTRPARDHRGQRARAARAARRRAVLLRPGSQDAGSRRACRSSRRSSITTSSARRLDRRRAAARARRAASAAHDRRRSGAGDARRAARQGRSRSPTWSASFPSCRALMGRYYARARQRAAGGRGRDRAALLAALRRRRAAATARSRKRSRSPTSSRRWPACSASARSPPATRIRSACAAHAIGVMRIVVEKALARAARRPRSASRSSAFARRAGRQADARDRARELSSTSACAATCATQGYSANQVEAVLCQRPARIDLVPAQAAAVQRVRRAAGSRRARCGEQADRQHPAQVRKRSGDRRRSRAPRRRRRARSVSRVPEAGAASSTTAARRAISPARSWRSRAAKPAVDRFFDDVLVMADDPAIRANRLALLRGVAQTMNRVADISKLAA